MARVVMDEGWTAHLDVEIAKMLDRFGDAIRDDAKTICPKDTGALAASIHSEMQDTGRSVRIIADAKVRGDGDEGDETYAVYVEEGTRHMAPQPYLRPSLFVQRGL